MEDSALRPSQPDTADDLPCEVTFLDNEITRILLPNSKRLLEATHALQAEAGDQDSDAIQRFSSAWTEVVGAVTNTHWQAFGKDFLKVPTLLTKIATKDNVRERLSEGLTNCFCTRCTEINQSSADRKVKLDQFTEIADAAVTKWAERFRVVVTDVDNNFEKAYMAISQSTRDKASKAIHGRHPGMEAFKKTLRELKMTDNSIAYPTKVGDLCLEASTRAASGAKGGVMSSIQQWIWTATKRG